MRRRLPPFLSRRTALAVAAAILVAGCGGEPRRAGSSHPSALAKDTGGLAKPCSPPCDGNAPNNAGRDGERYVTSSDGKGERSSKSGAQERYAYVKGRVVDEDGAPIVGIPVVAQGIGVPRPPVPDITADTDRRGQYVWALEPGTYRVTVLVRKGEPPSKKVTLTRRGQTRRVNFKIG